jgi:hypothetical protein
LKLEMKKASFLLRVLAALRETLRPAPEILRTRTMSDSELLDALSCDANHPMFQALLELIERGRNDARTNAKNVIHSDRETVFALGSEYGLDQLEEYLLNLRGEAMRQQAQRERAES